MTAAKIFFKLPAKRVVNPAMLSAASIKNPIPPPKYPP
jgi:hypothetical protein